MFAITLLALVATDAHAACEYDGTPSTYWLCLGELSADNEAAIADLEGGALPADATFEELTVESPTLTRSVTEFVVGGSWVGVGDGGAADLVSIASHRTVIVEVTVLAHDLNSNTNQRAFQQELLFTRNWDRDAEIDVLATAYDLTIGADVDIDLSVVDGDTLNLALTQTGGIDTNINWQAVARVHAVR